MKLGVVGREKEQSIEHLECLTCLLSPTCLYYTVMRSEGSSLPTPSLDPYVLCFPLIKFHHLSWFSRSFS